MSDVARESLERVSSGVPGLDVILSGGFLKGGTYIVSGPPGAGKTILGNQFCFHHVAGGGRAVYVTLLAESHERMIALLGAMRFFDPTRIASSLQYVSAYKTMEEQGLAGLLELLRKVLREHKATLLIIDGLVSAEAVAQSELAFKKFIHELQTLVTFLAVTTVLLTNGTARAVQPENTMVDGLVELHDELVGLRAVRELVVRKFRGSQHLRGRHFFEINDDGVVVYPRNEAVLTAPVLVPDQADGKLAFGVAGLDEMLDGGVPRGSTTLELGPAGSGKTVLGLHFLTAGARRGQPGLFVGFFESPPRVLASARKLGLDLAAFVDQGLLEVMWQPPVDLLADALAQRIFTAVRRGRAERIFIDGLIGFKEGAVYPERLARFFAAFSNELRALGATTLLSEETPQLFGPRIEVPVTGLSAVVENVLFLRQVEIRSRLHRLLSVLKTRDAPHHRELREFEITRKGIEVGGPFAPGEEAIMSGMAHHVTRPGRSKRKRKR